MASGLGEEPTPLPSQITVSGRVVKGVITGATVAVYAVNNSGLPQQVLGQSVTDHLGNYQVQIAPEHFGKPALVTVSASTVTTMRCDLLIGCDGQSFGTSVALPQEAVVLRSPIAALTETAVVNVNALTDLAVARVAMSGVFQAGSVHSVTTAIASRFQLIGDITQLNIIDITSESELQAASMSDLHFAFLNAVLLDLAVQTQALPYLQAWKNFRDSSVAQAIADMDIDPDVIDMQMVLERELNYAEAIGANHQNALNVASEVRASLALIKVEASSIRSPGMASATSTKSMIDKVKSFAREIRHVYFSIDFTKLLAIADVNAVTNGGALDAFGAFGLEFGGGDLSDNKSVTTLSDGVLAATKALFSVIIDYYSGKDIPENVDGIAINLNQNNKQFVLNVNQLYSACDDATPECMVRLDLVLTANIGTFGGNAASNAIALTNSTFQLLGQAQNSGASMEFQSPSETMKFDQLSIQLASNDIENGGTQENIYTGKNVKVTFPFSLTVNGETGDHRMDFDVNASLTDAAIINDIVRTITPQDNLFSVQETSTYSIYELSDLNLTMLISEEMNAGEKAVAIADLTQTSSLPNELVQFVSTSISTCAATDLSICVIDDEESLIVGETDDQYIGMAVSIISKGQLKGFDDPVEVHVTGERIGASSNDISSLKAIYPGHALALKGTFNNSGGIVNLSGHNLDGSFVKLTTNNGRREGQLFSSEGVPFANLLDMGEWIKITFSDNSFESL